MSLINDALRRAWQARRPPTKPADGPAMTPAETSPPARWPVAAVPLLLMGVLLVAVWFLHQGLQPTPQAPQSASGCAVAAREPPAEPILPAPSLSDDGGAVGLGLSNSGTQPVAPGPTLISPEVASAGANAPAGSVSAGAASNPTNTEPAGQSGVAPVATLPMPAPTNPPPPKLKAIFYRPSDPWAMINSKTVRIGDRYGPARVVSITPDSVTLVGDGQTNVLTLEH